ncbi:m7GpppX diphosphatase [Eumeta japonica]|uniref:m7GpppX diphosphatase n=1 Tax=Eumeta variegata TaxID=151549 RepID=A0A4C1UK80_EUMVA|nr:m7GpppX diphosphatase [Eumeta japonica]
MSDGQCQSDVCEPPSTKKIKINNQNEDHSNDIHIKLKDFVPEKILSNNTNRKTVCVLGKFESRPGVVLVILEKNAFKEDELNKDGYFSVENEVKTLFENDIYGNFECFPKSSINGVKTTVIYPASEKHIAKYSQQQRHIILETSELYNKYTLPHLEKEQFTLQWVHNILDGKSEQDRIVYDNKCEREGFVLLPDLKWDGVTKETLYLLAIVRAKGLKSLRDLNVEHLPLLKRIRDEGKKAIFDKYQIPGSQLRIYFHYQPSFYHLHVHFTYLKHEAPGIYAEKSHLLDTIINNIEMMSDYYQRASLPFVIREMDNLFNVYETNGYISRVKPNDNIELIDKSRRSSASSVESLSDCFSDEECAEVEVISIDEFCQLIPNSMSGLKINKNNISFRILTEPKTEGTIKFDRILELPSENIDMSDWFCHNHGGTSSADAIVLKSNNFLTKILYKIESSLNEEVETWISDPSIICTEISKNMFYNGIDHLKKMSLKVPESFRMTNGYFVSYLNV